MSEELTADGLAAKLAEIVEEAVTPALAYFEEVRKHLDEMVQACSRLGDASAAVGREFLQVVMEKEPPYRGVYRSLSLRSNIATCTVNANSGGPGSFEIVVNFSYSGSADKRLSWKFPRKETVSPQNMAVFLMRSLISPTDFFPE